MALPRKFKPHDLIILRELNTLCGRPILTSESREAYDRMLLGLIESLEPRDLTERLWVKDIATYTWEINRCTRHMALVPERKLQQLREQRAQHVKAAAQNKQAQIRKLAAENKDCEPSADLMRAALEKADAILQQSATELEHADAHERGMDYIERLDKLRNAAVAKRDDVLDQLARYRAVLGKHSWKPPVIDYEAETKYEKPERFNVEFFEDFILPELRKANQERTPPASSEAPVNCEVKQEESSQPPSESGVKQEDTPPASSGPPSNCQVNQKETAATSSQPPPGSEVKQEGPPPASAGTE
jgi:hypothetical protein